jgi:hypothetical protein
MRVSHAARPSKDLTRKLSKINVRDVTLIISLVMIVVSVDLLNKSRAGDFPLDGMRIHYLCRVSTAVQHSLQQA